MASGIINPAEARSEASRMKQIAEELHDLLELITRAFNEVNSDDTTMYKGTKTAGELRAELDGFSNTFGLVYDQIIKSADNIIASANTKEAE